MAGRKRKKISIRNKLLIIMLAVALLQGVFCFVAVGFNGGFEQLKKSADNTLINTTKARKNTLENLITNKWSNLKEYQKAIQDSIHTQLDQRHKTVLDLEENKELNNEILLEVSNQIVDMLRYSSTTEAYIILQGYGGKTDTDSHCGLCIRNLNQTMSISREGLLMETGPTEISRHLGIAMDSYWTSKMELGQDGQDTSFYDVPMESVEKYPEFEVSDLGYWSGFYKWNKNDISVISYAMPLVEDGEAYGVLGITVSEDYLGSLLPFGELDSKNAGSYMLAVTNNGTQYTPMYTAGIMESEFGEAGQKLKLAREPLENKVYEVNTHKESYGSVQEIGSYNVGSPYYNTKWALIGILPSKTLYRGPEQLRSSIMLAALLSAALGILGALIGIYSFARPILKLVNTLKRVDGNQRLTMPSTGVKEVDELSDAVTGLNEKVRDNASKVSKIIELVDLPLGIIEYRKKDAKVFCTPKVIGMLGMSQDRFEDGFIEKKYFERYWKRAGLEEALVTEIEREYQVNGEIPSRWLNIRSLIDKDRTLVTVMDITKDVYTRQKIEYERDYDILTHLLNRRAFKRRIQEILSGAPASGLGLSAMVMWDLDNLKYVNDTYGHDYGDQYIQKAAGVFAGLSLVGAIVGRMAGDEFLAFVPNCGSKEKLMDLLNQVKNKLNATKIIMPDGEELAIRASGGVAWYPDDGITYEMLKKYADFAMYDTKNSYKGAVKEFDQRVYEKDSYLLRGREQINRLIEDRMVDYAFQPIVDARSGQVHAYEALMRPRLGELSNPSDVLRLATVQSRLPELEELTFTQALKDYQRQREAFGDARIFINSIPNQLIDYGVIAKFQEKYGLEPNKLVVEIIENEQTDAGVMEKKIDIIRKMKAGLAIDDYGSGYSSELTLLYMSPDYVKIDMSIVRNVDKDVNRQALVASTIQYCKTRNIKIIGEGVETYDEMETLIRLGVDYMQGYYLGRPDLVARPVRESLREKILELQKLCVDKE